MLEYIRVLITGDRLEVKAPVHSLQRYSRVLDVNNLINAISDGSGAFPNSSIFIFTLYKEEIKLQDVIFNDYYFCRGKELEQLAIRLGLANALS